MSGDQSTRKVVYADAKGGESWPNGITLDFEAERIYWIDARSDSVNTVRYLSIVYLLIYLYIIHLLTIHY